MPLTSEENELLREMEDAARGPLQALMLTIAASQGIAS
jgi:hypothetical protein